MPGTSVLSVPSGRRATADEPGSFDSASALLAPESTAFALDVDIGLPWQAAADVAGCRNNEASGRAKRMIARFPRSRRDRATSKLRVAAACMLSVQGDLLATCNGAARVTPAVYTVKNKFYRKCNRFCFDYWKDQLCHVLATFLPQRNSFAVYAVLSA